MIRILTILLIFSFSLPALGQNKELEKLEAALPQAKDTARVNLLNRLAWKYGRIDPKKAVQYAGNAMKLSESLRYATGKAYATKCLGSAYSILGEYETSEKWLTVSLDLFKRLGNIIETGNIYNLFGLLYWERGDHSLALSNYSQAEKFYTDAGDLEGNVIAASNAGIIYYEQNDYDAALESYFKALENTDQFSNKRLEANLHTNIGLVYNELKNYKKALEHYNISLRTETVEGNRSGCAKSYTNIASSYFGLKQYDRSLSYHYQALSIYRQLDEKKGIARSLTSIGSITGLKGDLEEAIYYLKEALRLSREMNDKLGVVMALCELGELQFKNNQPEMTIASCRKAYELATGLSSAKYQAISSLQLARSYERTGNAEAALDFYKIYTETSEKLEEEQLNGGLAELQIQNETRDKNTEIKRLKEKSEANLLKKRIAVYGGIIILLAGTLFVAYLRKKHRQDTQTIKGELVVEQSKGKRLARNVSEIEQELEKNRRELIRFAGMLFDKTEAENTHADTLRENAVSLEELSSKRIVTEDDWDEFKLKFNRAFPGFMNSLKENFPAITTAELRLAALLRLELSSREVAAMLGISGDSVKKLRQRLRKKMNLEATASLEEVLAEIARKERLHEVNNVL